MTRTGSIIRTITNELMVSWTERLFLRFEDFDELSPFLENELLEKLKEKQSAGKFFEKLDI